MKTYLSSSDATTTPLQVSKVLEVVLSSKRLKKLHNKIIVKIMEASTNNENALPPTSSSKPFDRVHRLLYDSLLFDPVSIQQQSSNDEPFSQSSIAPNSTFLLTNSAHLYIREVIKTSVQRGERKRKENPPAEATVNGGEQPLPKQQPDQRLIETVAVAFLQPQPITTSSSTSSSTSSHSTIRYDKYVEPNHMKFRPKGIESII
jgi:hypothetical protein